MDDTSRQPIRIGILGCARIAPTAMIRPSLSLPGEVGVAGIASRDPGRARAFAAEHGIPRSYASYEALLEDPDLDVVYIPLANHLHTEWIVRAAEAGKHVLVEKPICLTMRDMDRIEEAAGRFGVRVMEAVMVRHHPFQGWLRERIESGVYGRLRRIDSAITHTYRLENNYRSIPEMGGGCFYDEGPYWLQFLQAVMPGNEPDGCLGQVVTRGPNQCDWEFQAEISYSDGVKAAFFTSFQQPYRAEHTLDFDGATLKIRDFFRARLGPFKIAVEIEERSGAIEKVAFPPQNFYVNQLQWVSRVVRGDADACLAQSAERVRLLERIMRSAAGTNTI